MMPRDSSLLVSPNRVMPMTTSTATLSEAPTLGSAAEASTASTGGAAVPPGTTPAHADKFLEFEDLFDIDLDRFLCRLGETSDDVSDPIADMLADADDVNTSDFLPPTNDLRTSATATASSTTTASSSYVQTILKDVPCVTSCADVFTTNSSAQLRHPPPQVHPQHYVQQQAFLDAHSPVQFASRLPVGGAAVQLHQPSVTHQPHANHHYYYATGSSMFDSGASLSAAPSSMSDRASAKSSLLDYYQPSSTHSVSAVVPNVSSPLALGSRSSAFLPINVFTGAVINGNLAMPPSSGESCGATPYGQVSTTCRTPNSTIASTDQRVVMQPDFSCSRSVTGASTSASAMAVGGPHKRALARRKKHHRASNAMPSVASNMVADYLLANNPPYHAQQPQSHQFAGQQTVDADVINLGDISQYGMVDPSRQYQHNYSNHHQSQMTQQQQEATTNNVCDNNMDDFNYADRAKRCFSAPSSPHMQPEMLLPGQSGAVSGRHHHHHPQRHNCAMSTGVVSDLSTHSIFDPADTLGAADDEDDSLIDSFFCPPVSTKGDTPATSTSSALRQQTSTDDSQQPNNNGDLAIPIDLDSFLPKSSSPAALSLFSSSPTRMYDFAHADTTALSLDLDLNIPLLPKAQEQVNRSVSNQVCSDSTPTEPRSTAFSFSNDRDQADVDCGPDETFNDYNSMSGHTIMTARHRFSPQFDRRRTTPAHRRVDVPPGIGRPVVPAFRPRTPQQGGAERSPYMGEAPMSKRRKRRNQPPGEPTNMRSSCQPQSHQYSMLTQGYHPYRFTQPHSGDKMPYYPSQSQLKNPNRKTQSDHGQEDFLETRCDNRKASGRQVLQSTVLRRLLGEQSDVALSAVLPEGDGGSRSTPVESVVVEDVMLNSVVVVSSDNEDGPKLSTTIEPTLLTVDGPDSSTLSLLEHGGEPRTPLSQGLRNLNLEISDKQRVSHFGQHSQPPPSHASRHSMSAHPSERAPFLTYNNNNLSTDTKPTTRKRSNSNRNDADNAEKPTSQLMKALIDCDSPLFVMARRKQQQNRSAKNAQSATIPSGGNNTSVCGNVQPDVQQNRLLANAALVNYTPPNNLALHHRRSSDKNGHFFNEVDAGSTSAFGKADDDSQMETLLSTPTPVRSPKQPPYLAGNSLGLVALSTEDPKVCAKPPTMDAAMTGPHFMRAASNETTRNDATGYPSRTLTQVGGLAASSLSSFSSTCFNQTVRGPPTFTATSLGGHHHHHQTPIGNVPPWYVGTQGQRASTNSRLYSRNNGTMSNFASTAGPTSMSTLHIDRAERKRLRHSSRQDYGMTRNGPPQTEPNDILSQAIRDADEAVRTRLHVRSFGCPFSECREFFDRQARLRAHVVRHLYGVHLVAGGDVSSSLLPSELEQQSSTGREVRLRCDAPGCRVGPFSSLAQLRGHINGHDLSDFRLLPRTECMQKVTCPVCFKINPSLGRLYFHLFEEHQLGTTQTWRKLSTFKYKDDSWLNDY